MTEQLYGGKAYCMWHVDYNIKWIGYILVSEEKCNFFFPYRIFIHTMEYGVLYAHICIDENWILFMNNKVIFFCCNSEKKRENEHFNMFESYFHYKDLENVLFMKVHIMLQQWIEILHFLIGFNLNKLFLLLFWFIRYVLCLIIHHIHTQYSLVCNALVFAVIKTFKFQV